MSVKLNFWKNLSENLIYLGFGVIFGGTVVFFAMRNSTKLLIDQLKPTIEKAIDKETIKNEITNDIEIKDNKIKKSDTLQININQQPLNDQKPQNSVVKKGTECPEGSYCITVEEMTRRQKKKRGLK